MGIIALTKILARAMTEDPREDILINAVSGNVDFHWKCSNLMIIVEEMMTKQFYVKYVQGTTTT